MATAPVYNASIQPNADAESPAEKGRYHLCVAYSCLFASRALSTRNLKGLEDIIGLSVAHPIAQKTKPDDSSDTHSGWAFVDPTTTSTVTDTNDNKYSTDGCMPDTVNHAKFVRDLFEMVDPTPRTFSVPLLWDKKKQTIVSDDSAGILRALGSGFRELVPSNIALFPKELETEIEEASNGIVQEVTGGYFKSKFIPDETVASGELSKAFAVVAQADKLLASQRYLVGNTITETDVCFFHTLIRTDADTKKEAGQKLTQFPNVVGYLRELYQILAFQKTVNWDHLKIALVSKLLHKPLGDGPFVDYEVAHDRSQL
ncbi:hypothetical protein BBJ29_009111 [Phytophthora kernoviae]|uniref:GST C-terminal domain-containing protein n=1 Tax=Phytophthora kernoviae TaxID=325452 RepID=A0A3F2RF72_9STRA|nr:hypothetical protein BBJ29_009111 [Phytophthora kernoviae]RLN55377.1 hypothetical protein BBP00_00008517 [Phytophthora kernoviae]